MYTIEATHQFLRQAKKFFKNHPSLKPRFEKLAEALAEDPFQPSLGLYALTGKMEGLWTVTLTYKYRVTLTLMVTKKGIILVDIGGHEDVYKSH
jgi:addiction module RelE/StbE family toxin